MICASFLLIASGLGWYWHHDADTTLSSHMIAAREATDAGIVETDSMGVILNVNINMEELTGYSRDDLIGKNIMQIMSPIGKERHPYDMGKIPKATVIVKCSLLMKDGSHNKVVVIARIANGKYISSITKEDDIIDHFTNPSA